MVANATRTEYLALSHSSRSCSRVIISRGASLEGLWLSVTVNKDESSSSRVSKPEVVFFSKAWTLLYVALNFREPDTLVSVITIKRRQLVRGQTLDISSILHRSACRLGQKSHGPPPKIVCGTNTRGRRQANREKTPRKHLLPVTDTAP